MSVIIVGLPQLESAKKIKKILQEQGFQNLFAFSSASSVLQTVTQNNCGIVISGYQLSDMHYLELLDNLPNGFELLLIGSAAAVGNTPTDVLTLSMPIKVYDLVNTVEMMLSQIEPRFKKKKTPKARSEREENYIRNAKFLLIERNHLTEEDAHRYVQKCSMDNGTNMVETAQMILMLLYDEL